MPRTTRHILPPLGGALLLIATTLAGCSAPAPSNTGSSASTPTSTARSSSPQSTPTPAQGAQTHTTSAPEQPTSAESAETTSQTDSAASSENNNLTTEQQVAPEQRSDSPSEAANTSSDSSVTTPAYTAPTTPPRREGNDATHSVGTQERVLTYTYRVTGEHELTFEVQPSDRTCTDLRWVFSEENGVFSIAFIEGVRADTADVCTSQGWVSTVHFETSAPARSLKVQPLSTDKAQLNR